MRELNCKEIDAVVGGLSGNSTEVVGYAPWWVIAGYSSPKIQPTDLSSQQASYTSHSYF